MNKFKKIFAILTILGVVGIVTTPSAQAVTVDELMAQIAALQAQLNTLRGSSGTGACTFTKNLYMGVRGDDVKCLQTYLMGAGQSIPAGATSYFGSQTKAAVSAWQAANSVSPAVGYFGSLSRAKYTSLTGGVSLDPGTGGGIAGCVGTTEGSFTATLAASPSNSTVDAGNDLGLFGVDIRAYGSDITVGRVDLRVTVAQGATTYAPHTLISNVAAYDGSTQLTKLTGVTFSQDSDLVYFLQVPGLKFKVPKDTTKTLTFKMDTTTGLDNNRTVTARTYGANGIRGTDCAGLNTFAEVTTTRTHTVQVPGQSTLTLAIAQDSLVQNNQYSPAVGNILIPVLKFTAAATGGSAKLKKLAIDITSGTASRILATTLRLKDGDTVVQSVTGDNNTIVTFDNFTYTIPINTVKTFTVEGDYLPVDSTTNTNPTNNFIARVAIPATSANCQFERGDSTLQNCTVAAQIDSKNQYLFRQGAKFDLISATANVQSNGVDDEVYVGVVKFKVTPFNGAFTKFRLASLVIEATATGDNDTIYVSARDAADAFLNVASSSVPTITMIPDENLQAGNAGTATLTMTMADKSSTTFGQIRYKVHFLAWETGTEIRDQGHINNTAGDDMLDAWVTPYLPLN